MSNSLFTTAQIFYLRASQLTCFTLAFFTCSLSISAEPCDTSTSSEEANPGSYLEFSSEMDGKCQNLSQGGKLRIVKNTHPDKDIRYRFVRMFSGKPQAGLVIGTIEHGSKPVKLGCTLVDGRDQNWEIKIAKFTD